jgi:hypothetical protein
LHGGTDDRRHQIKCLQHLRQIIASEVYHQVAEAKFLLGAVLIDDRLMRTLHSFSTQGDAQGESQCVVRAASLIGFLPQTFERPP